MKSKGGELMDEEKVFKKALKRIFQTMQVEIQDALLKVFPWLEGESLSIAESYALIKYFDNVGISEAQAKIGLLLGDIKMLGDASNIHRKLDKVLPVIEQRVCDIFGEKKKQLDVLIENLEIIKGL